MYRLLWIGNERESRLQCGASEPGSAGRRAGMRLPFTTRRKRARAEALAWLARLKRGLRPQEGPEFLAWLRRRSHRNLIAKAALEWHGPEVLAVLAEIFPIDPARLEPRRGTHPAIMAGAAVVSACLAFLPFELSLTGSKDHWYATSPKETKRLALEDGTHVALNRGTGISVVYLEHIRSVLVAQGEAVFTVARSPHRPFHVRAADRDFETTSGTFDVHVVGPNRMSITVLAGTVTAFPPAPRRPPDDVDADSLLYKPILIEPLQMLVIEPDEESGRRVTEQDLRARLAWQRGS